MTTLEEIVYETQASSQWRKIGVRHHHGICIPLFSLHSEESCGIGEFFDLIHLIFWCKDIGLDIIQLLPINDMGLGTSPYNAISAFALNPIHLSLLHLEQVDAVPQYEEKISKMRYWNKTQRVKYHIVRETKLAFLRQYFKLMFAEISESSDYKNFEKQNPWVRDYALFKAIKESQFWQHWDEWPSHLKNPSEKGYEELSWQMISESQFHTFLQYLCFQQLGRVRKIASDQGVFIKGDIPILIGRDSADVWRHRHLFLMDFAAGAPPDMYAKEGQYWGFPIYDWIAHERNDYSWWTQRLQVASQLFHMYRIDHIVGFFRMWAIPLGKPAKEGMFLPEREEEWIPHGKKLMQMMLEAAPILPVGEDLGLVPADVKKCLYDLGICGTKMMRWERRWEGDGGFIPVTEYEPMTMTTVSTHDSDTLQQWWRHNPKEAKLYCDFKKWEYLPFLSSDKQKNILWDSHHSSSLLHINLLQEYLALFPGLVSPNSNEERINVPGRVLETNWTYRFRPQIEEIISHHQLRQAMIDIIQ